jgi:hypothetical protein
MHLFCAGIGANTPDITTASRRMKASEFADCQANGVTEITEIQIGYDGLAFASAQGGITMNLTPEIVYRALAASPYGKALRREFFDYLAANNAMRRSTTWLWPIVRWVNSILMLKREDRFAVVHYTERVISKVSGQNFQFKRMWSNLDGALYCFCVNKAAKTYFKHLSETEPFHATEATTENQRSG